MFLPSLPLGHLSTCSTAVFYNHTCEKKRKATFIVVQKGFFVHAPINSRTSLPGRIIYYFKLYLASFLDQKPEDFVLFCLSVEVLIVIAVGSRYA